MKVSVFRFQDLAPHLPDTSYETTFDECGSRNVECGRMESLREIFSI